MQVQSYLNFDGRCEEALEFYKKSVGATVNCMMRFSESPEPCDPNMVPPGSEHKVMHASFTVGETELMASDCNSQGQPKFQGVSLALTASSVAESERLFAALGDGGQVQMPMTKTFFSPSFGMVADKFGVSWMVLARGE